MRTSIIRSSLTFMAVVSIAVALAVSVSTSQGQSDALEVPVSLDPLVYSDIRTLRADLHLTTEELAAIGTDEAAAEQVLTELLQWYETNQADLHRRWQATSQAKATSAQAWRAYHQGGASQALGAQSIRNAEQALEGARAEYQRLLDQVRTRVQGRLNGEQAQRWAAVARHTDLPVPARLLNTLDANLAGSLTASLQSGERLDKSAALSAYQKSEVGVVSSRIQTLRPAVHAAERRVLPPPPEPKPLVLPNQSRD